MRIELHKGSELQRLLTPDDAVETVWLAEMAARAACDRVLRMRTGTNDRDDNVIMIAIGV